MTTLPSYFLEALTAIEPDDDAANAKDAHAEVRKVLKESEELKKLGIDPVLIGSYARSVSIKRVKDVDLFARLNDADSDLRPGATLDLFEAALEPIYGDRLSPQARSFKIDFPDVGLSVDVVPARPKNDHWEIPKKTDQDNRASWVETNPLELNALTVQANTDFLLGERGIYVPVVKLVRQIRRTWCGLQPGGFFYEVMTYWAFINGQPRCTTIAECLVDVLTHIADQLPDVEPDKLPDPTIEDKFILTKATEDEFDISIAGIEAARDRAIKALKEPDDCKSALLWQELLGKDSDGETVFKMPEFCNSDGTTKASSTGTNTKGATTGPAGSGRYA